MHPDSSSCYSSYFLSRILTSCCTACILCFIFHSIPCIVVGVWVCLCKCGRMHVCISVPKASVDKRDVFLDALVACAHPPKTLTVELNGLKRSEREIPELHLKALLRSRFCLSAWFYWQVRSVKWGPTRCRRTNNLFVCFHACFVHASEWVTNESTGSDGSYHN